MTDDLLVRAGKVWATGVGQLHVDFDYGPHRLMIGVICLLGGSPVQHVAMLDTAAEWSILPRGLAPDEDIEPLGEVIAMSTRFGSIRGEVSALVVTLPAVRGHALEVDAKVLVTEDWPGPIVLGFRGLLERVRFAVDPGASSSDQPSLFFGSA